jgi:hypothetical protein
MNPVYTFPSCEGYLLLYIFRCSSHTKLKEERILWTRVCVSVRFPLDLYRPNPYDTELLEHIVATMEKC